MPSERRLAPSCVFCRTNPPPFSMQPHPQLQLHGKKPPMAPVSPNHESSENCSLSSRIMTTRLARRCRDNLHSKEHTKTQGGIGPGTAGLVLWKGAEGPKVCELDTNLHPRTGGLNHDRCQGLTTSSTKLTTVPHVRMPVCFISTQKPVPLHWPNRAAYTVVPSFVSHVG